MTECDVILFLIHKRAPNKAAHHSVDCLLTDLQRQYGHHEDGLLRHLVEVLHNGLTLGRWPWMTDAHHDKLKLIKGDSA